jgi:hypothetical protein
MNTEMGRDDDVKVTIAVKLGQLLVDGAGKNRSRYKFN